MDELTKLLKFRNLYDEYQKIINIKGIKTEKDVSNYKQSLRDIGFISTKQAFDINLKLNLIEADNCFRFRRKDNFETPALCDGCEGRSVISCIGVACGGGDTEMSIFDEYTPDSLIVKEQRDESIRINRAPLFFIRPLSVFHLERLNEYTTPYCIGVRYKIKEPDFDIFWGMDFHCEFGETMVLNQIKANE